MIGIIISANNYIGFSGHRYNIFNHFISELGQYECSRSAGVFNICLIIGAPCLIYYYLKIIPQDPMNIQLLFKLIIILIGISAISIGIFSMDNILMHIIVALIFFYLCFFSSILFNIYVLFIYKKSISKYFIYSGILVSITTSLNIIQFHQLDSSMLLVLENRPSILFICFIEWLSLLAMLIFYFNSIIFFNRKSGT